jgi:hypothetical protein
VWPVAVILNAGWVAVTLTGSALLYFGVLLACGLRPRQFMRRG